MTRSVSEPSTARSAPRSNATAARASIWLVVWRSTHGADGNRCSFALKMRQRPDGRFCHRFLKKLSPEAKYLLRRPRVFHRYARARKRDSLWKCNFLHNFSNTALTHYPPCDLARPVAALRSWGRALGIDHRIKHRRLSPPVIFGLIERQIGVMNHLSRGRCLIKTGCRDPDRGRNSAWFALIRNRLLQPRNQTLRLCHEVCVMGGLSDRPE